MIYNITKIELIKYFYNECSPSVSQLIELELDANPDWSYYINHLQTVKNATKIDLKPNDTLVSMILEESAATEHHSL
jgi:hypothetical protein